MPTTIAARLFPRTIDNTYNGRRAALWLFALVVSLQIVQSLMLMFNGAATLRDADGIPLDTYPAAAVRTILAISALYALARLWISGLCIAVLVRYRSAIPLMFAVLLAYFLAVRLILWSLPIERSGAPPGPLMNAALMALTTAGLALSLWSRRDLEDRPGVTH
jgi:hypothetical protein